MKTLNGLVLTGLLSLFSTQADADLPVSAIACYGEIGGISFYFDDQPAGISVHYSKEGVEDSFQSIPSSFGRRVSKVEVSHPPYGDTTLRAHIISGDMETPVFDSHIEVRLVRDIIDGTLSVGSLSVYRLGVELPLQYLVGVGTRCYVQ